MKLDRLVDIANGQDQMIDTVDPQRAGSPPLGLGQFRIASTITASSGSGLRATGAIVGSSPIAQNRACHQWGRYPHALGRGMNP